MDPVSFSLPLSVNTVPGTNQIVNSDNGKLPENDGLSFQQVLTGAAQDVSQSIQTAEATSIAGIKGDAGAYEVAMSVMEAEQQLRMAAAIRDRTVQAFQELSRMQI